MLGLFNDQSSPFDDVIEKVTAETLSTENWALILDICDKINSNPTQHSKLALMSIRKRLNHRDPHVVMYALSVLDSCWCNCGQPFRREVSSAAFINQLQANCTSGTRLIAEKARLMVKKWTENECASDASLSLVSSLFARLKEDGHSFESSEPKKVAPVVTDPYAVTSQEEEDALAKAIAMSLEEQDKRKVVKTSKLYPNSAATNGHTNKTENKIERKVRALYDFEAAEDNELSFVSGDIITVIDDNDSNWWRGRIGLQQGLFPSNFVTFDLEPTPEPVDLKPVAQQNQQVAQVDESLLLRCIQMLEALDPTGEVADPPELAQIEAAANTQAPLIDARLAAIDRQHNALASIDMAIRDVLNLYDHAVQSAQYQPTYQMQQPPAPANTQPQAQAQQPYPMHQQQHPSMYQQPQMSMSSGANMMPQQQVPVSDASMYGQAGGHPQTSTYPGYLPQTSSVPSMPASSAGYNNPSVSASIPHNHQPVQSVYAPQHPAMQMQPTYSVTQPTVHPYQ
ncbi:hypothetical protein WR25_11924 isoform A [Diploscapter pachys]|uniref:Signal transducing adapter molecule 1 n=2 Tax=Diploscapter pachys TaxID=2018661 RepID=A0A2A2LT98_9BILA|nr:hypothetical protein WR25_11924 isoform A [Diploscapter pachys]